MSKPQLLALFVAMGSALLLAGCAASDEELTTKAPPPKEGAVTEQAPPGRQLIGAEQPTDMSGGGQGSAAAKPSGM